MDSHSAISFWMGRIRSSEESLGTWEWQSVRKVEGKLGLRIIMQGRKFWGIMKALVSRKNLSVECAGSMHDRIFVPTFMYGCEIYFLGVGKK